MKPLLPALSFLVVSVVLSGCANYAHTRTTVQLVPQKDGTVITNTITETTKLSEQLNKTALSGLKSKTADGSYSRELSLGRFGTDISAELGTIAHEAAAGAAEGAAKGVKP